MNAIPFKLSCVLTVLLLPGLPAHAQLPEIDLEIADFDRQIMVQSQMPEAPASVFEIQTTEPAQISETEAVALYPPADVTPDTVIHTVAPGETAYRITRRYGITLAQLRQWNQMPDDIIEVGTKLIVSTPPPSKDFPAKEREFKGTQVPRVPTITPTSAFNLAYNDYLNGKYDLAVAGFQRFVQDFPGTSLTPNAYYWLGESSYQQKDYARAMRSFEYITTEYPGNEKVPGALFKSGLAAGETGDLAKSRQYLRRVIEEFPTSDESRLARIKLSQTK